jgi:signal transduction histidine kinase/ActR/RegA family two-component response regulator
MLRKLEAIDLDEANRCLRDIVALSTLPALWLGADTTRVAESLAAALFTTIGPQLIYVSLEETSGTSVTVAQTDRYHTDPVLAADIGPRIIEWARTSDPDDLLVLEDVMGAALHVSARPLGFDAGFGVVAAGFRPGHVPTPLQHTLLGVAATQATSAVQNMQLLRSLRDSVAERARAEQALRESDRRKDEFIATLSHELRNPLAPLKSSLQLMRVAGQSNTARPTVEMMERQVDHLIRLVDDLLEISRISRGSFELRKQPVELATVVRNAIETSDPLIRGAGHRLSVELPAEPVVLDGDAVRLSQILANLLNNAAKYTQRGGQITVRTALRNGNVDIAVRDNGMGIGADLMPRLFEMFTRGVEAGVVVQGGLGIGLALARRLAEMHGGSIEAQSDGPGRGSEFIVRLPVAAGARAPQKAAARSRGFFGPRRILVVDDNRDAAETLSMLLQFLGVEVRLEHDGPSALAVLESFDPSVVLLDIGMPDMDGYEVARRIRARSDGQRICLVALTGWGQQEDRERARAAGFDHHLVKPADIAALKAILDSLSAEQTASADLSAAR